MRIRLHSLGMVQGIASCIHWGSIWEVANGVSEDCPGQRRARSVGIWANGLRVVDGIAGPVHGCAIWQVASAWLLGNSMRQKDAPKSPNSATVARTIANTRGLELGIICKPWKLTLAMLHLFCSCS